MIRQAIGFLVLFAGNVRDAKLQSTRQLAAHPVQGIEARAAAGVLARHLLHDQLRIGIDAERGGVQVNGALQGFKQGSIFSHIVVMVTDPLGDPDHLAIGLLNEYANARRARAAVGTAVNVCNEI